MTRRLLVALALLACALAPGQGCRRGTPYSGASSLGQPITEEHVHFDVAYSNLAIGFDSRPVCHWFIVLRSEPQQVGVTVLLVPFDPAGPVLSRGEVYSCTIPARDVSLQGSIANARTLPAFEKVSRARKRRMGWLESDLKRVRPRAAHHLHAPSPLRVGSHGSQIISDENRNDPARTDVVVYSSMATSFADEIVLTRAGEVVQRREMSEMFEAPADKFARRFVSAQTRAAAGAPVPRQVALTGVSAERESRA